MKLLTYLHDNTPTLGLLRGEEVVALSSIAPDMLTLIDGGSEALARVREFAATAPATLPLANVRLLAPIPTPRRNVICLGKNYAEHARESYEARGEQVITTEYPVIFTKATTSVNGPYDDIPVDDAISAQMDYAELAFIIGRPARRVTRAEAMSYVFGYTVLNDVTARDLQTAHKQFHVGKSLDGCCPIGPWIVTADAIADPHALRITCHVNGELRQDSAGEVMTFDIPTIIEILSRTMTLLPGDIIATGTPRGVGFARKPPVFLRPGDVVECAIEGIGAIRNRIRG